MNDRLARTMWMLALTMIVMVSCARERDIGPTASRAQPCGEGDASLVDQALLAWLSKARTVHQVHHLADVAEDEGSADKAIASLVQLATGPMPSGSHPEVAEVMADTFARLAELRARSGAYKGAEEDVASGLKYAPGATYFRGHLLEVRGLIYDKESRELEKSGQSAEAKSARDRAVEASLEAIRIQNEVIKRTLGDAGAPPKRD
jgi:hypothetical protein